MTEICWLYEIRINLIWCSWVWFYYIAYWYFHFHQLMLDKVSRHPLAWAHMLYAKFKNSKTTFKNMLQKCIVLEKAISKYNRKNKNLKIMFYGAWRYFISIIRVKFIISSANVEIIMSWQFSCNIFINLWLKYHSQVIKGIFSCWGKN